MVRRKQWHGISGQGCLPRSETTFDHNRKVRTKQLRRVTFVAHPHVLPVRFNKKCDSGANGFHRAVDDNAFESEAGVAERFDLGAGFVGGAEIG